MVITFPNLLTLLRILAVPFFAIAVWYGHMVDACFLFVAAGLTDVLDGYLARRFNQKSALGAILDPAADKLLITTAFILLAFPREAWAVRLPPWVTILAISRDAVIALAAVPVLLTLIRTRTWQLAKRQLTWFRREPQLQWIQIGCEEQPSETATRVRDIFHQQEKSLAR